MVENFILNNFKGYFFYKCASFYRKRNLFTDILKCKKRYKHVHVCIYINNMFSKLN